MKAFELAKKLNITTQQVTNLLKLKSPNQNLTQDQETFVENSIAHPESKHFSEISDDVKIKSIGINKKTHTVIIFELSLTDEEEISGVQIVSKRTFPSLAQAFAHGDYLMAKLEMGDL